jgi:imidazolonepropionase-like amidohydrolase
VTPGLSTVDALRAATVAPARFFGLTDRGVIEPGRRGDLVLIDGDPVHDIRAARSISRVWCGGVERTRLTHGGHPCALPPSATASA